jgi:uncharacterized membrane protein
MNYFSDRSMLLIIGLAGGLLLLVLELVRRRAIAERYSLLWILASCGVLALALLRPLLDQLALLVGIDYPPSALFLVGFLALLVILLYFTVIITQLTRQSRVAAQQIGLLQQRLSELENELQYVKNSSKTDQALD